MQKMLIQKAKDDFTNLEWSSSVSEALATI